MTLCDEFADAADGTTTVLIVDDHRAFADLLSLAFASESDLEVCAIATTAEEGVTLAARLQPSVVVLDIQLGGSGGQDGLAAAARIRSLVPDTLIVMVTAHRDAKWVARAASAGANAFAPKSGSLDELLSVLRRARLGSIVVAESVETAGSPSIDRSSALPRLSAREQQILELMAGGMAPAAMSRTLHLSVHTCRDYVKSIRAKLDVSSQLEAVVTARRLGLLDSDY